MVVKRTLVVLLGVALAVLCLGSLGAVAQSSELDAGVVFDVPFRPMDTSDPIDGIIGSDWQDGLRSDIQLGGYPAVLYARHNGEDIFLAIELFDAGVTLLCDDLTFCFVFDNGDGQLFGDGDDCVEVHLDDRLETDGDHHGTGCGQFVSDDQQDAAGYGTWSLGDAGITYTIEISRPIDSSDDSDVPLPTCTTTLFAIRFCCTVDDSAIRVEQTYEGFIHPVSGPVTSPPIPEPSTLGGLPYHNPAIEDAPCAVCEANTTQSFYPSVFDQTSGEGVFLHNGELYLQETDVVIPGRGLSWSLERTYRSESLDDGPFG
ncbi:MAG: DUF6531 domain-containing protein, partial [Candidatus Bipolaricaulia bacterium]